MNAKISVFVTCVQAIMLSLLHNLHDCTFKFQTFKEEGGRDGYQN